MAPIFVDARACLLAIDKQWPPLLALLFQLPAIMSQYHVGFSSFHGFYY
jgi:hypothetical protein